MNNGVTSYPANFANTRGIPMIASTSVTVGTDNVVIGIPSNAFRGLANSGLIAFRLTQAVPAGGAALPVVFSSNNFTNTVTVLGGGAATGANITPTGVYLVWYDKSANLIQLITTAPAAAAA